MLLRAQDWQGLYQRAMELANPSEQPAFTSYEQMDEAQQAAALLKFAKRGQPMRAFHAISSLGLAPPTILLDRPFTGYLAPLRPRMMLRPSAVNGNESCMTTASPQHPSWA
eukprot:3721028-Amphidinium_carterae.1